MTGVKNRLSRLRAGFAARGIDAVLISQPENRLYLSGFDGSAGFLLITGERAVIATDFRYIEQAERQSPDYDIFQIKGARADWLSRLIATEKPQRLGVEAGHITLSLYQRLSDILKRERPRLKLVAVDNLVEDLRAMKEPDEIALITEAAATADAAMKHIGDIIDVGMTEQQIAWEADKFIREKGGEPPSFETIVAAGPNAALPHSKPSSRPIQEGEPIIIDMGARSGGYASDMSRTFCLGAPDGRFTEVYNTVLAAQLAAIDGIEEGMTGHQVDRIARVVIEKTGYGEAFGHGLGHGVGLAVHEAPRLGPNSKERLASGMVLTIEPGIYLSEWGGVRIEDLLVLDSGTVRVLSRADKTLEDNK